jgi:hypothetical protein
LDVVAVRPQLPLPGCDQSRTYPITPAPYKANSLGTFLELALDTDNAFVVESLVQQQLAIPVIRDSRIAESVVDGLPAVGIAVFHLVDCAA